jgi:hypothetical protein
MENNLEAWCERLLEMHFEVRLCLISLKAPIETDKWLGSDNSEENSSACSRIFDYGSGQEGYLHVESSRAYSHE